MAGQALLVKDNKMAINTHSVNRAAPLASQPKMRSAIGPDRAAFIGEEGVMTGPEELADKGRGISLAESVVDTLGAKDEANPTPEAYFNATGLPDSSFT